MERLLSGDGGFSFSGSIREVIEFCVQLKKLNRFCVEFIFFKKVLDLSRRGIYIIIYHDRLYSVGKEFFCLENIKES